MKKRFSLIQHWLKAAEKDYEADRKTEGELNLLLAQAEARRAWELSCQEEEKEILSRDSSKFSWKITAGLALGLLFFALFHFSSSPVPETPPLERQSPAPTVQLKTAPLLTEKKMVKPVSSSVSKEKRQSWRTETKQFVQEKERPREMVQPVTPRPDPIQVDMIGLVQEAERALYQGGANKHIEKEATP